MENNSLLGYTEMPVQSIPFIPTLYENLPMQYTEIFSAVKIESILRKKFDILKI